MNIRVPKKYRKKLIATLLTHTPRTLRVARHLELQSRLTKELENELRNGQEQRS